MGNQNDNVMEIGDVWDHTEYSELELQVYAYVYIYIEFIRVYTVE